MSSFLTDLGSFPRVLPAGPVSWPEGAALPGGVLEAEGAFRAAVAAWRGERRALTAEVTLDPEVRVVRRDDPRRVGVVTPTLTPGARVAWDPLRSETLLAEARVFEAIGAWREAWCEALIEARRVPVVLARAEAEVEEVRASLAALQEEGASAESLVVREAMLAVEEASWQLEEAQGSTAGVAVDLGGDARPAGSLPGPRPVEELPAFLALTLREAAALARSERRRVAAFLPSLGVEVGYAGSQGRLEARWALREGRQRAALEGAWRGTPQERGWAEVSASFRFGSDAREAQETVRDAEDAMVRAQEGFIEAWEAEVASTERAHAFALERWRLAEARVEDARSLDQARRAYLRYLTALRRAALARGVWPSFDK